MPIAATGDDVAVNYTTQALIQQDLPAAFLTSQAVNAGPSNTPGLLSIDDLTDMIRNYSRQIDGRLWRRFQVPFPDVTATSPRLPDPIREICTAWCSDRIRVILALGNRRAPDVEWAERRAAYLLAELEANPNHLGKVRVRTPENPFVQVGTGTGSGYNEAGQMASVWYRLKNRNVDFSTLRFVREDGSEAFRPDELPFGPWLDWARMNAAEGTLAVFNIGQIQTIINLLGPGGGVIYEWSWRKFEYGTTGSRYPTGVTRK